MQATESIQLQLSSNLDNMKRQVALMTQQLARQHVAPASDNPLSRNDRPSGPGPSSDANRSPFKSTAATRQGSMTTVFQGGTVVTRSRSPTKPAAEASLPRISGFDTATNSQPSSPSSGAPGAGPVSRTFVTSTATAPFKRSSTHIADQASSQAQRLVSIPTDSMSALRRAIIGSQSSYEAAEEGRQRRPGSGTGTSLVTSTLPSMCGSDVEAVDQVRLGYRGLTTAGMARKMRAARGAVNLCDQQLPAYFKRSKRSDVYYVD